MSQSVITPEKAKEENLHEVSSTYGHKLDSTLNYIVLGLFSMCIANAP